MYKTKLDKLVIRLAGVINCNHPAEFASPFMFNDKLDDGSYGPLYPGYMCGLCYRKIEMPFIERIDVRMIESAR